MRAWWLGWALAVLGACSNPAEPPPPAAPSNHPDASSPDAESPEPGADAALDLPDVTLFPPHDAGPDAGEPVGCKMTCDRPPPVSCHDGTTVLTWSAAESCDARGECVYLERRETCNAPPAASCKDARTQILHAPIGTCSAGACVYTPREATCSSPPAPVCAGSVLKTSAPDGTCAQGACSYAVTETNCGALGCCGDHCCEIEVSNVGEYGSIQATGLVTMPPNGPFDTDADCLPNAVLGRCGPVTSSAAVDACVCKVDTLKIDRIGVIGRRALVILALDTIEITGLLDVAAAGVTVGPGASFTFPQPAAERTGGEGGTLDARSDPALVPLKGGASGQAGCMALAGGGGGALQLSAGVRIEISGVINANGGGGRGGAGGDDCNGGAGGGSGGAILLEAPSVELGGTFVANGGGGGGGGGSNVLGAPGATGLVSNTMAAEGGTAKWQIGCPLFGDILTGAGGNGAVLGAPAEPGSNGAAETRCLSGAVYTGGGGGGGGVGRIRVNAIGAPTMTGAVFSPVPTVGSLRLR